MATKKKKKQDLAEQIISGTYKSSVLGNKYSRGSQSSFPARKTNLGGSVTAGKSNTREELTDIAPTRTWFQAPKAFDDGFDLMDIPKTILGTTADIGIGAVKGIANIGEGIGDLITYGEAQVFDALGKDNIADNLREEASRSLTNDFFDPIEKKLASNSIMGEKADGISEGLGFIAGTMATGGLASMATKGILAPTIATTGQTFLTSMGSSMGEAYKGGASDKEAWTYGTIGGLAEAGTELLFGGLGKAVGAVGLSKGLSSLDDQVASKVASKFKSTLAKNLAEYGIKAGGEGFEEVASGVIQAMGQWVTYASEKDLLDLVNDQDLLEQFIVGSVVSGIAQVPGKQGIVNTTKEGRDFVTGFTENEQRVVDAEVNERVNALKEKTGKEVSNKELAKIKQEVNEDFEKGYVKTDLIESTLGKDIDLSKDYRLGESYNEKARRSENFTYEASNDMSEFKKATYESAKEVANNTNRTHELVDAVAQMSDDRGVSYKFTNNEKLAEMKKTKQGKIVNGLYEVDVDGKKEIYVNVDSNKYLEQILVHETFHDIKNSNDTTLSDEIIKATTEFAMANGDYQDIFMEVSKNYDKVYKGKDKDALIGEEVTARLLEDYIGTDTFIESLTTKKPSVLKSFIDEIKYLVKKFKAGTPEARKLVELEHKMEKAYKKAYKSETKKVEVKKKDTRFSMSEETDNKGRTLSKGMQDFMIDSKTRDSEGKLITYYNGSGDFTIFDKNKMSNMSKWGKGIYLTKYEDVANMYGDNVKELYVNITNPISQDEKTISFKQYNDLYKSINDGENAYREEYDMYNNDLDLLWDITNKGSWADYAEQIKEHTGKDGLIINSDTKAEDMVIAFSSNQVKNVTNENPTDNPDIRYSVSEDDARYPFDDIPADDIRVTNATDVTNYKTNYENVPDNLLGFRKQGENKGFNEEKYKYTLDLLVSVDGGKTYFEDAIKGLNYKQAIERAKRNWEGAILKTNPTNSDDIRYSVSEDNQGRTLSKGMQEFMVDSKSRVDEDVNKPLVRVYHTVNHELEQFDEFNAVGTQGYRFDDQEVNFYTDSKIMSGSYANQEYEMADTKRINNMDEFKEFLDRKLKHSTRTIEFQEDKDGYKLVDYTDKIIYDKALEYYNETFTEEERKLIKEIRENNDNIWKLIDKTNGNNEISREEKQAKVKDLLSKIRYEANEVHNLSGRRIQAFKKIMGNNNQYEGFKIRDKFDLIMNQSKGVQTEAKILGNFKTEEELFRNARRTLDKALGIQNAYQYEGYTNITNPYVIDAEGRYWDKVRKVETERLKNIRSMPQELKTRLTELAKESKSVDEAIAIKKAKYERAIENLNETNKSIFELYSMIGKEDKLGGFLDGDFSEPGIVNFFLHRLSAHELIPKEVWQDYTIVERKTDPKSLFIKEEIKEKTKEVREKIKNATIEFNSKTMSMKDFVIEKEKFDIKAHGNSLMNYFVSEMYSDNDFRNEVEDTTGLEFAYSYVKEELFDLAYNEFNDDILMKYFGRNQSTNDIVKQIIEENKNGANYDGVIIKNVIDYGGNSDTNEPANLYITFNANQFKAVDNENPTLDRDMRYSLSGKDDIAPTSASGTLGEEVKLQVEEAIAPIMEELQALRNEISNTTTREEETNSIVEAPSNTLDLPKAPTKDELFDKWLNERVYNDKLKKNLDTLKLYKNEFKDYYVDTNGNIIARTNDGKYSTIIDNKFMFDGEQLPKDNYYKNDNFSTDRIKINEEDFKNISEIDNEKIVDVLFSDYAPITLEDLPNIEALNDVSLTGEAPIRNNLTPKQSDLLDYLEDNEQSLDERDLRTLEGLRELEGSNISGDNFYKEVSFKEPRDIKTDIQNKLGVNTKVASKIYKQIVGLENFNLDDVKSVVNDYSELVIEETDRELKDIKEIIRKTQLDVSHLKQTDRNFKEIVPKAFGSMRLANSGNGIDVFYEEMSSKYPAYFPSDITTEADQFNKLFDVAKSDIKTYENLEVPQEVLDEIASSLYVDIKQMQQMEALEKTQKDFNYRIKKRKIKPPIIESVSNTNNLGDIAPIRNDVKTEMTTYENQLQEYVAPKEPKEPKEVPKVEKSSARQLKDSFKRLFVNSYQEIDNLAKDTGNTKLTHKANMLNAVAGELQGINNYQSDNYGNKVGEAITTIFGKYKKLGLGEVIDDYLFNKSNIERHKQGKGSIVPMEVSNRLVNEYEQTYPELIEINREIAVYFDNQINNQVEAGLITRELGTKLRDMYHSYVPFKVENAESRYYTNDGLIKAPSILKKAVGGVNQNELLGFEEAILNQTASQMIAVRKNKLYKEIINTLNKGEYVAIGGDVDMNNALYTDSEGRRVLSAYDNGNLISSYISEDMYKALNNELEENIKKLENEWRFVTKPLQKASEIRRNLLTTWNPFFLMTNPIKDIHDAVFNSKYTKDMMKNYIPAFKELFTNSTPLVRQFKQLYGSGGNFGEYDGNINPNAKNKGFLAKSSELLDILELAPRYAEFKASIENGTSVEEAMYNARDITTDFSRGGVITKALNRNGFTFLNASVQGFDKLYRNFSGENGAKGYANILSKAVLMGIAPAILNHLLLDDDEEYEALPDYIKDNYYIFKSGDGEFVRIPKGRTLSIFGSAGRRTLELMGGETDAFDGYIKNAYSQVGVANPLENNLFAPLIQAYGSENGRTWYGTDLVPTRLQSVPTGEQYDETTDAISKFAGKLSDLPIIGKYASPYKINYVLDQYSGGIGDIFLPMITEEATSDSSPLIAPFKDKFTANSTFDNKYVGDFYTAKDKAEISANSSMATDIDTLKSKYLYSVSSEMGKLYGEKREIQADTSLSKEEKYKRVQAIQDEINRLAKEGLDAYENVNKTSNYAVIGDKEYYKYTDSEGNEKWGVPYDDELETLNSLGLDVDEKSSYYEAKALTSEITSRYKTELENASDEEKDTLYANRKMEIASAVINSNMSDDAKYVLYSKHYGNDTTKYFSKLEIPADAYIEYDAQNFVADKYSNGKTIPNSKKAKVFDYINNMNLDFEQKVILSKLEYNSYDEWNYEIIDYLNNSILSYEEEVELLEKMGFEVDDKGNIYW